MTHATWLAEELRAARCAVKEYAGWRMRGGAFRRGCRAVVWHHDASPPGDSPGVPGYMIRQMEAGQPGAQLWVDRRGVWHVLAAGTAAHAGRVRSGMPGNSNSLGVETDHTTGEDWPPLMLASLRRGTAAILRRLGEDCHGLHFHSSVCDPVGRKTDPHGLDLAAERRHIDRLLHPANQEDDIMASLDDLRAVVAAEINRLSGGPRRRDQDGVVYDTDPQTISVADVYTLLEQVAARPCTCACQKPAA